MMKFIHEDRFIIGLMSLWGFVNAVAPHYQHIFLFNFIICVWVLYEAIITVIRNRNTLPTILSIFIGLLLYVGVRMTIITNFINIKWDVVLSIGVLNGLLVNYLSLKS